MPSSPTKVINVINVRRSGRLRNDNQSKQEVEHVSIEHKNSKTSPPTKRSKTSIEPEITKAVIDQSDLDGKTYNILIGITGSVATIKLIELVKKLNSSFPTKTESGDNKLQNCQVKIKIVMTQNSQHFVSKTKIINELKDSNIEGVYDDSDEWSAWKQIGDPVLHIDLRKWADLFVIAPLDANTMAKISNGLCDNLVTCVVRAWDLKKPLLFCPAMNCHMYEHPVTKEHLDKLKSWGYICIEPVEKRLACGDVGIGGMSSVDTISENIIDHLTTNQNKKHQETTNNLNMNGHSSNNCETFGPITTSSSLLDSKHKKPTFNQSIDIRSLLNSAHTKPKPSSQIFINISEIKDSASTSRDNPITHPKSLESSHLNSNFLSTKPNINHKNISKLYNNIDSGGTCMNGFHDLNYPDFDPSELLEQTMITDDVTSNTRYDLDISNRNNTGTPSDEQLRYLTKFNMSSPVLNIAKFMALCDNKEKSCFTCAICKNDYKNRKSMSRHFKEQHVQGCIYKCLTCGVGFKRREKLIKHNREKHPNDIDKPSVLLK